MDNWIDRMESSSSITSNVEDALRERLGIVNVYIDTVVPASRPLKIGDIFVNRTLAKVYIATGIATSSDWSILN